jgi:hypothetical protein
MGFGFPDWPSLESPQMSLSRSFRVKLSGSVDGQWRARWMTATPPETHALPRATCPLAASNQGPAWPQGEIGSRTDSLGWVPSPIALQRSPKKSGAISFLASCFDACQSHGNVIKHPWSKTTRLPRSMFRSLDNCPSSSCPPIACHAESQLVTASTVFGTRCRCLLRLRPRLFVQYEPGSVLLTTRAFVIAVTWNVNWKFPLGCPNPRAGY